MTKDVLRIEKIYKGVSISNQRLLEINCGEFEGIEETAEAMTLFWQAVATGDKGTEPFTDFTNRNCDFCDMLSKEYVGQNILIITHAANARIINYYFTGKSHTYDFKKAVAGRGEIVTFLN